MVKTQQKESNAPEYIEKLVAINRVSKVVKGGRKFGFAAIVVVGDGKGKVGYGTGKAKEVPEAVAKASQEARRDMVKVSLKEGRTIHHDIKARYGAGKIMMRSAPAGTGVIAGGPMRAVFEALGVQDVVAKSNGSANPHNMLHATFSALKSLNAPKFVAQKRGLKIGEIVQQRDGKKQQDQD